MEKGQCFSCVQRDEHLHEELLVLCLQRQRKPIDDTVNRKTAGQCWDRSLCRKTKQQHELNTTRSEQGLAVSIFASWNKRDFSENLEHWVESKMKTKPEGPFSLGVQESTSSPQVTLSTSLFIICSVSRKDMTEYRPGLYDTTEFYFLWLLLKQHMIFVSLCFFVCVAKRGPIT